MYISFPATTAQTVTIKIFSITGEVVFSLRTPNYRLPTSIDVKDFSNGIYFVSVQTEKDIVTKKIVVNH